MPAPNDTLNGYYTQGALAGRSVSSVTPDELAAAGATAPAPISRTIDTPAAPAADPASTFLDTFRAPQTADQIAEQKRKDAQAYIDSTNKVYDDEVAQKKQEGQQRLDANNSVSVLSGLMGSTEAVRTNNAVSAANQKEIDAVNNQRAQRLSSIYRQITSDAQTEARQQLQDATLSAQQIVERRAKVQEQSVNNLKLMASTGLVNFDSFKNNPQNADVYKHALESVGGSEDALRGLFMLNRPQDTIVGTPQRMGDKFIQAYKNPLTGKVSYESIDLPFDLPPNYSKFEKLGDNLVAVPDNWNGDVSQIKTIIGKPDPLKALQIEGQRLDNQKKQNDLAATTGADPEKTRETIGLVKSSLKNATDLAGASGRSGIRKTIEGALVGSTDYTNLVAETNTLKTNVLTLMADPTIKKFFGPQMSNADVTLMTSAGTTLNPELQSPDKMKAELGRLGDLINRMEKSVPASSSATADTASADPASAAIGATVTINGIQYKKTGADAYEPL